MMTDKIGLMEEIAGGPFKASFVPKHWHDRISVMPPPADFADKGDCWIWTGWNNGKGHGKVREGGLAWYVHRLIFEKFYKVTLYGGHVIDHLCRRRGCFNPLHIECVSALENYERGDGPEYQFKKPEEYQSHLSEEDLAALRGEF